MKHALVTGGAGFIGRRVVAALRRKQWTVTVVDNLSTSGSYIPADWGSEVTVLCRPVHAALPTLDAQYQVIFHLAAIVGVSRVITNPWAVLRAHHAETTMVGRMARRWGATVVFASSSEVYGTMPPRPLDEDSPSILPPPTAGPRWAYAASKLHAEHALLAQAARYGLRVVIPRYFNVVGPGQSPAGGNVIPTWARDAVRDGRPIIVHGDGQQSRSFCHVDEAAEATVALATVAAAWGRIVNVGCHRTYRMVDVAHLMRDACVRAGYCPPVVFGSWPKASGYAQLLHRVPDVTLLRDLLGLDGVLSDPFPAVLDEVVMEWHAKSFAEVPDACHACPAR